MSPHKTMQRYRGVASVEAAVVMPLFILAFTSILYVGNQVLAHQQTEARARACAWLYSAANCEPNSMPAGCSEVLRRVSIAERVDQAIESKLEGALVWPFDVVISTVLRPVLEAAFGSAVDAHTQLEYAKPGPYASDRSTVNGSYRLACNVSPTTPQAVAKDAWKAIRNAF